MSGTKAASVKPKGQTAAPLPSPPNLVCFTVDVGAGRVIRVEKLDGPDVRAELSQEERASLAVDSQPVEALIEQAFEAGISCLLSGEVEPDNGEESQEEAVLRHVLLTGLLEKTPVKNLLQKEVLSRAILCTAMQQSWSKQQSVPKERT